MAFRLGLLVAIRAKLTGLNGVMITASHNGPGDNGMKIVEKDGSMLAQSWEEWAEILINSHDIKASLQNMNELYCKGLPIGFDIFDYQPVPKAPIGAETL